MRSAIRFAVARDPIRADVIEISGYPQLARRYAVLGVPKVVINDAYAFEGALPPEEFARAIADAVGRSADGAGGREG